MAHFERAIDTLRELAAVLGLFQKQPKASNSGGQDLVGPLMDLMIELRAAARSNKDFATADRIRDGLTALDIQIEDRKGETVWRQG